MDKDDKKNKKTKRGKKDSDSRSGSPAPGMNRLRPKAGDKQAQNVKQTQSADTSKDKKSASPGAQDGVDDKSEGLRVNRQEDWRQIRENWARSQTERVRAHASRFFANDEELPLSRHFVLIFIALFFVFFIVWASFATLDEVTRGNGKIIPSGEVKVIQNLEGGIVEEFFAREGDIVEKGDVIIRLRDVGAVSDYQSTRTQYLGLRAEVAKLQALVSGKETIDFPEAVQEDAPGSVQDQRNAFRARKEELRSQRNVIQKQLAQRRQEVREIRTKISDLRKVITLSQEEKDMIEPLVRRGSAPKVELIQLERGIQERRSELNSLQASLPRAESAIAEARARLDQLGKEASAKAQDKLSEKLTKVKSLKERLTALEDRKVRKEIRSPVRGEIQDFKINTIGGVLKPGDPIAEIVPIDETLLADVRIRPSDIAFIYPGQPAVVKITAYDFSIYGGLKGEVADISADTITLEDGKSFYRVRVRTNDKTLERKDEVLPIKPGMVASVDIMTGEKTVMQYLLKPFVKTLDKAMNER